MSDFLETRLERAAARWQGPLGLLLAGVAVAFAVLVARAPQDQLQGLVQKILYVHVPCAFAAYLGFALTALGGVLYLWRENDAYDRLATASAGVGVVFCTLVVLTGPIWAQAMWGKPWALADPRLLVTTILWFIYLAYILLRAFTEGSVRTARFAAVYGIVGFFAVPLNYFAIELAGGRSVHPENLQRGSLDTGMGWPFVLGVVTALAAFFYLLFLRLEVEGLRLQLHQRSAEDGAATEA